MYIFKINLHVQTQPNYERCLFRLCRVLIPQNDDDVDEDENNIQHRKKLHVVDAVVHGRMVKNVYPYLYFIVFPFLNYIHCRMSDDER